MSDADSASEKLIITCIPSLVATLLNRERAKGSPLTEEEVIAIRDNCPAKAVTAAELRAIEERRGYQDIDPARPWEEWQQARLVFVAADENGNESETQGEAAPASDVAEAVADSSRLVIFIEPSLASVLHLREREKGSPLTEEEVLEIRDNSEAVVITADEAHERETARGFQDIDPERVWEEWQEVRLKLPQAPQG
ncbi:hypothetical protein [Haloferula sp. BvORR071]|uniref:hypothetical protein n=1 Tax=Haloferula sp. BvORR071 TaxID=1396141 RepID=UPI000696CAC8|nr:hypothetical protein [Haloferula sp. BvORR071]